MALPLQVSAVGWTKLRGVPSLADWPWSPLLRCTVGASQWPLVPVPLYTSLMNTRAELWWRGGASGRDHVEPGPIPLAQQLGQGRVPIHSHTLERARLPHPGLLGWPQGAHEVRVPGNLPGEEAGALATSPRGIWASEQPFQCLCPPRGPSACAPGAQGPADGKPVLCSK